MRICQGKGVSPGIAIGKIWVYRDIKKEVCRREVADPEAEVARYEDAKRRALVQLQDLYENAVSEVGEEEAAIFDVHQMMLEDGNYNETVKKQIYDECVNAEYAVDRTGAYFAEVFQAMEDDYIRERAADILDVSERIVQILSGAEGEDAALSDRPVIVVAQDLTPSQTVQLDREKVLAFVTTKGSAISHTAILAKTMGVAAIVGVDFAEDWQGFDGLMGAVNAEEGLFYIEPDETAQKVLSEASKQQESKMQAENANKGKETVTSDGRRIELCANVGSLKDLESAIENDAEGIGLFRSEFLYLEREDYPTEEEQYEIYKQVVETMKDKPVIIRTLDIGADKQSTYMNLAEEKNPTMGCRGIRVCLIRPEIFKLQLRALFRAAQFGDLRIMYPMITSMDEIRQIKAIVQEVKDTLTGEGIGFKEPKQGIMVETPAAALISDVLAKEVEFFSIGTNDLTQYTQACDRENGELERFYDVHHPAVMRLIAMTVENAHRAGIPVGICGELAGDESLLQEWLKIGVDELSVAPGSILRLRGLIRKS